MASAEPVSPESQLLWLRLWPITFVAMLTVLWGAQPNIPVKVRGSGLLTSPESRRPIYARGAGEVQQVKVKVGDLVQEGELLLSLNRVGQAAPGAVWLLRQIPR